MKLSASTNFFHCLGVAEQVVALGISGLCLVGLLWHDVFCVTNNFGLVGKSEWPKNCVKFVKKVQKAHYLLFRSHMNAIHFPHLDSKELFITQMASFIWSNEERKLLLKVSSTSDCKFAYQRKKDFCLVFSVFRIFNLIISKAFKSQARSFSKPSLFL